ncbi:MAG: hypothetical protein GXY77_11085 [Fibrobacter sp.]|nr:hypothetical protein [Fibrobacter sp.]
MEKQIQKAIPVLLIISALILFADSSYALPPAGYNKVAYYTFDATPVDQDVLSLTTFTDEANVVIVFEGTLWELADTVHYDTQWMRNKVYKSKRKILDDIQSLREKGILVLMNVDDAPSWSTETPFTAWNGKKCDYREFAAFVDSCVKVVGFDGISLDVEHNAVDNTHYRNLIREFGKYFGPLSSDSLTTIYTAAVYNSRYGVPGEIFREEDVSRYLNFVMDMGYHHDNEIRFAFWADHLGASKVMPGMSHQDNSLKSAMDWLSRHPAPETAGIMVYAANVNKQYTDSILSVLGDPPVRSDRKITGRVGYTSMHVERYQRSFMFHFSLKSAATVSLNIVSLNGRICRKIFDNHCLSGNHVTKWNYSENGKSTIAAGVHYAVLDIDGVVMSVPFVVF